MKLVPIYYNPPEPRYGMPAFPDLLQKIAGFYKENKTKIIIM
jgi:uncharacterized protein YyaL (SSP411 family)